MIQIDECFSTGLGWNHHLANPDTQCMVYNVELAIKNQGAIIIFQVHHHDFRGKQILITFSKALIKFAIDMLYYYFFWPKTPSRNNKLLKNQVAIKKIFFWARIFF